MDIKDWVTQLRKGLLEFCILNVLSEGENYGYEIVQKLKQLEEMEILESTVYPILSRLRKDGYLKVRAAPSPSGPPRRYFSLTLDGKRRVAEMNVYWSGFVKSIRTIQGKERFNDVTSSRY